MIFRHVLNIILLSLITISVTAQQDALYSQYLFNHFVVNPAYAGSRRGISATLLSRQQWVGFEGAPSTQSFSVHGPIKGRKMALGFNIVNDAIGPSENTSISGTYAYHLPLLKGNLSMALRFGAYKYTLKVNSLKYQYNDPVQLQFDDEYISNTVPTYDFGLYYYTHRFYAGIAMLHLFPSTTVFNNYSNLYGDIYELTTHFVATVGKAYLLNEAMLLKPSLMLRSVNDVSYMDFNISCLFNKKFLLGITYRTVKAMSFITEFNVKESLRIGYSFDVAFSKLKNYNSGSHEIFIGFDFNVAKSKSSTYRYL